MGAVIGTLLAELVSCAWQFMYIEKTMECKKSFRNIFWYLLIGVVMFFAVRLIALISLPVILKMIIEIGVGALVFLGLCVLYWKISKNEFGQIIFNDFLIRMSILRNR